MRRICINITEINFYHKMYTVHIELRYSYKHTCNIYIVPRFHTFSSTHNYPVRVISSGIINYFYGATFKTFNKQECKILHHESCAANQNVQLY